MFFRKFLESYVLKIKIFALHVFAPLVVRLSRLPADPSFPFPHSVYRMFRSFHGFSSRFGLRFFLKPVKLISDTFWKLLTFLFCLGWVGSDVTRTKRIGRSSLFILKAHPEPQVV